MSEVTITLSTPVQFGKDSEPVTELVLKPTARACRELSLTVSPDGGFKFEPYTVALIGLKMAGVGGGPAFLDRMSVPDLMALAQAVVGFFGEGPTKT